MIQPAPPVQANVYPKDTPNSVGFTATMLFAAGAVSDAQKTRYRRAVAATAGEPNDQNIEVTPAKTRRGPAWFRLATKIRADPADTSDVDRILGALGQGEGFQTALNENLEAQSLPTASSVTNPVGTKAAKVSEDKSGDTTGAIIGSAAGVFVAVSVGVFLYIRNKRRSGSYADLRPVLSNVDNGHAPQPGFPWRKASARKAMFVSRSRLRSATDLDVCAGKVHAGKISPRPASSARTAVNISSRTANFVFQNASPENENKVKGATAVRSSMVRPRVLNVHNPCVRSHQTIPDHQDTAHVQLHASTRNCMLVIIGLLEVGVLLP